MSSKIKIFLFAMALIAIFSVRQFLLNFSSDLSDSDAKAVANMLAQVESDSDKDGLNDFEESLWNTDFTNPDSDEDGFLDGEEVSSGHDPLIKGPNDVISGPQNITEKVGELLVGGLSEGSLKPTHDAYGKSIDMVTDEVFSQFAVNSYTAPVALNVVENNATNKIAYAKSFGEFLLKDFKRDGEDYNTFLEILSDGDIYLNEIGNIPHKPHVYDKIKTFIDETNPRLRSQQEKLRTMNVPKDFESIHQSLLKFVLDLEKNYTAFLQVEKDPIYAILAFNQLMRLFTEVLPPLVNASI